MSNAVPPIASHFVVILYEVEINLDAAAVWRKIGGFSDAGRFLDVRCELISGNGGVGSIRQIGDEVTEVMVDAGPTSYAYAQNRGPMAVYCYHGSVHVLSTSATTSRLTYTIVYDHTLMSEEKRSFELARLSARFRSAAEAMKHFSEA